MSQDRTIAEEVDPVLLRCRDISIEPIRWHGPAGKQADAGMLTLLPETLRRAVCRDPREYDPYSHLGPIS